MTKERAFFAYPSRPNEIVQTIRTAIQKYNLPNAPVVMVPWQANDVSGIPITTPIFENILSSVFVAADITFLNDNVVFEVGYAIGKQKRCILFRNTSIVGDTELTSRVGIFDTLGWEEYSSSDEIAQFLVKRQDFNPISFDAVVNHKAPVYVVEPPKRTDAFGTLISRVKKARWMYRAFSPSEDIRLSAMDAIRHVAQSAGVIAPLLPNSADQQREHNIRALFAAGISVALDIPTLIIHPSDYTPPADIHDLTRRYSHPNDIINIVQEFSLDVTEYSQRGESEIKGNENILQNLRIGDPSAENEMTTLASYYIATDEYQRALRGEVNLVVGRKGSGKTALFVQLRNAKRSDRQNVVVDLKPEGYQLIKLKERVLDHLTLGARQHLITAFWEYLLLLEITHKVLQKDEKLHLRDHRLTGKYQRLKEMYGTSDIAVEGDFSERLLRISNAVVYDYQARFSGKDDMSITTNQVTGIVYKHDIRVLSNYLIDYLSFKKEVWLLFDNLDKGWDVQGVSDTDILVLQCLINASRKLDREFRKSNLKFQSIIFIRDDVYSLLMLGSSDYGKEMRASLDWSDRELLAEMLKRRIAFSLNEDRSVSFSSIWPRVAVSHYVGERAIDHLIERSLMRPRNLVKIFRYSLGFAINLGHEKIEMDDISRGLKTYSQDLVTEVDRELRDVFPQASRLIYEFSEENARYTHGDLLTLIEMFGLAEAEGVKVIEFFLYYGLLGVQRGDEDPLYIFDVNYDLEMLRVRVRKWGNATVYMVNPALWPALAIKDDRTHSLAS